MQVHQPRTRKIMLDQKFSQYSVESDLSDILKHGDVPEIAKRTGRGESILYQMTNPHDERVSDFYRTAQFLAALADHSPERGRAALRLLSSLVAKHLPQDHEINTDAAFAKSIKEYGEAITARVVGKPLAEQYKEISEVIDALQDARRAVRYELDREKKDEIAADIFGRAN